MSYRKITRPDSNQAEIVAGLRRCGVTVWIIGEPCDVLTYYHGRWLPMEIKKPEFKRPRKDQDAQTTFIRTYAVPVVKTLQEALDALRIEYAEVRFRAEKRENHQNVGIRDDAS